MRVGQVIAGVSLAIGVLVIAAFSYVLWSREVTLIEDKWGYRSEAIRLLHLSSESQRRRQNMATPEEHVQR